jgi:hypothetical protein
MREAAMAKISTAILAIAILGLATGALAQADGAGGGAASSPPNLNPLPPTFFGPFHTNMPMVMGPGPADSAAVQPGGTSGVGAGSGAPGPAVSGMAGLPWGFAGGVGRAPQPPAAQPATTAQPAATVARTAPSIMFRRFGQ